MGSNGSFYQNGLPLSTTETGLGNVAPGVPVANKANGSMYIAGSAYTTLQNSDALLAAITAQQNSATADAAAALASQTAASLSQIAAAASVVTLGTTALLKGNNLSDLASVPTALTNLGLNNVTNTSDANKPVSTAQAAADALVASNAAAATALKANIASPAFTGVPTTASTPAALDNSLKLATTAYADAAVSVLSGTTNTALALKASVASLASYATLASPALTGTPVAPTATAGTNSTQIATTAFVLANGTVLGSSTPLMDSGAGAVGTATVAAHADHVHPTDTSRAPLASPALTGVPTAPTAAALTNNTQIATTAYADTAGALKAPLASPALSGVPTAPTATTGTNTSQLATTAFVAASLTASGVASFATRTGAVVPLATDYAAVATNFTASQTFTLATLVDGASIAWATGSAQKAQVTLAGNRTMAAVTGAVAGTTYYLWVIQDATGSRTLAYTTTGAGSFDFGTAGAPTLTLTASKADLLCFEAVSIAGTLKLRYCGIAKGFS